MTSASKFLIDGVYPAMTNSCPRLTRIFCQAPERKARLIPAAAALCDEAFQPLCFYRTNQVWKACLKDGRIPNRVRQCRQNVLFDQFPPLHQWLGHYFPATKHHQIEDKK